MVASLIDLDRIATAWKVVVIRNFLLQCSLFVFGEAGDTGNRSWIRFDKLGIPLGFQPAELGKILFIFTFSRHMYELRERKNSLAAIFALMMHALGIAGIVFVTSSDLGMVIMYLALTIILLFAGGISLGWIAGISALGATGFAVLWPYLPDYQRLRILVVFEPDLSDKYAYQAKQGMMAIGSGQISGSGFMSGRLTQASSGLPAKHTDFIFATVGEEWGFIGSVFRIVLLAAIVLRICYDSARTNE